MNIRKAVMGDREQLIGLSIKFDNLANTTLSETQIKFRAYKDLVKTVMENTERFLSKPEFFVFVADEEGVLMGFIAGEIKENKQRIYDKEGYIAGWYMEENYQGQGIGKQLFDSLSEEFEKAGCTHIGLDTHLENTKAIQIYEQMGFTKRLITFFKILKDLS